ncbi:MAG: PDZ domain-containing protein [bacterium]
MNRLSIKIPIIAAIVTITITSIGIANMFGLSSDKITYKTGIHESVVSFVAPDSPAYMANIQIDDTVKSISGRKFKSIMDMNKNIIERLETGSIAVYEILRDGETLFVPIQMTPKYSPNFMFLMTFILILFLFVTNVFYVTFPYRSQFTLLIYIFYQIITIIIVYSNTNYSVIPLYTVFILATSVAPTVVIYLAWSLKKPVKKIHRLLPILISAAVASGWFAGYLFFILSSTNTAFRILISIVKSVQFILSLMIILGIKELISSISINFKEKNRIFVSYILSFLIAGFTPFIVLYAIPFILGKKEILPVWFAVSFSAIPLLGIIMFNGFFHKIIQKGD